MGGGGGGTCTREFLRLQEFFKDLCLCKDLDTHPVIEAVKIARYLVEPRRSFSHLRSRFCLAKSQIGTKYS